MDLKMATCYLEIRNKDLPVMSLTFTISVSNMFVVRHLIPEITLNKIHMLLSNIIIHITNRLQTSDKFTNKNVKKVKYNL